MRTMLPPVSRPPRGKTSNGNLTIPVTFKLGTHFDKAQVLRATALEISNNDRLSTQW